MEPRLLHALLALFCAGATPARDESPSPTSDVERSPIRFVEDPAGIDFVATCGGAEKRSILEVNGSGVAVFDFDGDSDLDLYFPDGTTLEDAAYWRWKPGRLFRNEGGRKFVDATEGAGLRARGWGMGVAVGDVDADGLPDLFQANYGVNALYRNEGKGRFIEQGWGRGIARGGPYSRLPGAGSDGRWNDFIGGTGYPEKTRPEYARDFFWSSSAAFADYDADGDLDLYVARYLDLGDPANPPIGEIEGLPCLWRGIPVLCGPHGFEASGPGDLFRNDGRGEFEDWDDEAGISSLQGTKASYGLGVLWSDLDADGLLDLFVANDSTPNDLFWNEGGGKLREAALASGVAFDMEGKARAGMGVSAGDLDGDGLPDLVVANFSEEPVSVFRHASAREFRDDSFASGVGAPTLATLGWGTALEDFDGDFDLDLFVANGHVYPEADRTGTGSTYAQACQLFVNDGRGKFAPADGGPALAEKRGHRAVATGDLDDDGDPDLVVTTLGGRPRLLWNESGAEGLTIRFRGASSSSGFAGLGVAIESDATGSAIDRALAGGGSFQAASAEEVYVPASAFAQGERLRAYVAFPSGREAAVDLAPLVRDSAESRVVVAVEPKPAGAGLDAGIAGPRSAGEIALERARALLEEKRFAEALEALQPALAESSPPREARFLEGLARLELNDLEGARIALEAERAAHPDHARASSALGHVRALQGDDAGAVPLFDEAIRLEPGFVEARYLLGLSLHRLGKDDRAQPLLFEFVTKAPFHEQAASAHFVLAAIARSRGDEEVAAAHLRRHERLTLYHQVFAMRTARLAADPGDFESLLAMGLLAFERGDSGEAESWYGKAAAADPSSAKARFLLGDARRRVGKRGEAEGDYRAALALDPSHKDARHNLALLLSETGRKEESREEFERFVALHPDLPDGYLGLAMVEDLHFANPDAALAHYAEYRAHGGKDPRVLDRERAVRAAVEAKAPPPKGH